MEFTDRDAWFDAVDLMTTIGFTEFPNGTFVTDHYEELGVLFTDGVDVIVCCGDNFPNDLAGLNGVGSISLEFTTPQAWIALDFPGFAQFSPFSQGELIYTSSMFGADPVGNFAGLISSQLFDAAILIDPADDAIFIDDLHFGVPAPAALWLLGLAALRPARRRRC
jgi:hypothetical protein